MTVTREEIVYAYRLVLGREPENEAAVEQALAVTELAELWPNYPDSSDFEQTKELSIGGSLTSSPVITGIDCTDDPREAMFNPFYKRGHRAIDSCLNYLSAGRGQAFSHIFLVERQC